jgi:hypothetical protein
VNVVVVVKEPTKASQVRAVSPESGDLVWQGVQFFFSVQFAWDTLVPLSIVLLTFVFALGRFFSPLSASSPPPRSAPTRSSSSSLLPACTLLALHAVSLLCSAIYWTFQRLALLDHFVYVWKIAFPRVVYASSLLSLVILLALLLLERRRQRRQERDRASDTAAASLQGTFVVLGMVVCVPVMLVFGPGSCWTFASFLCAPLLFLDVNARMKAGDQQQLHDDSDKEDDGDDDAATRHKEKTGSDGGGAVTLEDAAVRQRSLARKAKHLASSDRLVDIQHHQQHQQHQQATGPRLSLGVSEVVVWAFFAILLFYKSGHLCDFSSLQFEAPFIGTPPPSSLPNQI